MLLTPQLVQWAIDTLRQTCHPFIGVTFLASKHIGLPVGVMTEVRLDAVTKSHLEKHHRLDPKSEFFFQPFKSTKNTFWVAANYPSSGLQAINTQTFSAALLHRPRTPQWALAEGYADKIRDRIRDLSGYAPSPLAALAIWIGKDSPWPADATIETIVRCFRETFCITDDEVKKLFDTSVLPTPDIEITTDGSLDLKAIAYSFAISPDAPTETEGALSCIHLKNIGPARELLMNFGERLTLIAGDNGLGKSFLLDVGWWALTGTWAGRPAYPFAPGGSVQPRIEYTIQNATGQQLSGESAFDWKTHTWPQSNSPPSVAALSIYARVDGSFAIADDTRSRVNSSIPTSLTLFTTREVWDGKAGEIEGLIRDWVNWQLSTDSGPFTMLSRVLEHLSPEDIGPLIPTDPIRIPGDPRRIPAIKHVYGEVPIVFTSAGVQRILQLAYLIIWSWQEHILAAQQTGTPPLNKMVIVVDELEAHLHPKWQRLVLPALMSIGKLLSDQLEVQVIAATHSPMVLASVEDDFSEESDLLVHLSLVDGLVNLETLDFYKFGDVSSWLTSPVFGLSHARSRSAEQAIQQAKGLQLAEDPSLDAVRQVTARLKQTLAPDDSFWSRWIYFARQLGDDI